MLFFTLLQILSESARASGRVVRNLQDCVEIIITTQNIAHDRFIVLDYGTKDEWVFHCGPSSKDAGNKLAAITEFMDCTVKKMIHDAVTKMMGNPV